MEGLSCQRAHGGKERDHKYLVKEKRAGRSEDCGDEHRNKRTQVQKRQGRVSWKEIVRKRVTMLQHGNSKVRERINSHEAS